MIKIKQLAGYWRLLAVLVIIFPVFAQPVAALTNDDLQSIIQETPFYDPNDTGTAGGSTGSCGTGGSIGGSLDQILQAVALHESNDNPTADSGDGAYGKYQFIPSTWQNDAASLYPPAQQYTTANLAPEAYQDAVAYLANIGPYKSYNGDPFWLAVNWYGGSGIVNAAYPDKNSPILQVVPQGNDDLSYAGYGNLISQAVQTGQYNGRSLSSVALYYENAPNFQMYLAKAGGAPSAGGSTSGSCGSACNVAGTSIPAASTGGNSNDAQILCAAEQYSGIYYSQANHTGNYATFRQECPLSTLSTAASTSTAADPGPCSTDCSGLVSIAVDQAFNQNYFWIVQNNTMVDQEGSGSQYWQFVPMDQVQAGDIVTFASYRGQQDDHVAIVDHYDAGSQTLYIFQASTFGQQIGPSTAGPGVFQQAYRWHGPGSGL